MSSLILRTAALFVHPLLLLFSLFLLVRGHNEPGGGFAGGLVAGAAFALSAVSRGLPFVRAGLRVQPLVLVGIGLCVAGASGLAAVFGGGAYLAGRWVQVDLPLLGPVDLGTPLLFDIGVYLVVLGVVLKILYSFMEEG
jgi:multicomponent Na+:H+ antiporter subunit B